MNCGIAQHTYWTQPQTKTFTNQPQLLAYGDKSHKNKLFHRNPHMWLFHFDSTYHNLTGNLQIVLAWPMSSESQTYVYFWVQQCHYHTLFLTVIGNNTNEQFAASQTIKHRVKSFPCTQGVQIKFKQSQNHHGSLTIIIFVAKWKCAQLNPMCLDSSDHQLGISRGIILACDMLTVSETYMWFYSREYQIQKSILTTKCHENKFEISRLSN